MGEEKHLSAQGGVAHADASEEVLSPLFPSSADTSSEDLLCGASAGAQPGAAEAGGPTGETGTGEAGADNVVDAEFEEVKDNKKNSA